MSACTNAYWPRSGERGSRFELEQLAPHERRAAAARGRASSMPATAARAATREALAQDGGVLERAPVGGSSASRRDAMSARSVSGTASSVRSPTGRYAPSTSLQPPVGESIRTVSTAYSGMPSARPTIGRDGRVRQARARGRRAARASRASGSGSRASAREVAAAGAPVGPAVEQLRPGERDDAGSAGRATSRAGGR